MPYFQDPSGACLYGFCHVDAWFAGRTHADEWFDFFGVVGAPETGLV